MMRVSFSIAVVMIATATVSAQRPNDRPDRPGRPPRGFGGPPGFHLMTALDVDKDGKISAKEIENAARALQKLDKDKNGKLSQEEIGWPPSFGGGGFPGFGGGRGRGGFPGFDAQANRRPQRPDPDAEGAGSSGTPKRRSFFSVDQLQRLDRNDDGKITKEEIPKRMQELILGRVDANDDGVIDKGELAKLAKPKNEQQ